jgi:prepilin-type N-terminal cleavage/methylation domain-containing protein
MNTQNLKRESGFTLLELLLVIGVAALLLIGAIATYRLVTDGNKTTDSIRLLLTIRQETQTMSQQQGGTYTGITYTSTTADATGTTPLVSAGVLHSQQRNPFNGDILINPKDNTATADNITVEFDNVSQSGCIKLVSAINTPNEIISVSTPNKTLTTFPVITSDAATACASPTNNITWQFP